MKVVVKEHFLTPVIAHYDVYKKVGKQLQQYGSAPCFGTGSV
jgi:hypothetical protein